MSGAAPAPRDEDQEAELLRRAIDAARASVRDGRVVPHDRVREWLKALAEGEQVPYPRP